MILLRWSWRWQKNVAVTVTIFVAWRWRWCELCHFFQSVTVKDFLPESVTCHRLSLYYTGNSVRYYYNLSPLASTGMVLYSCRSKQIFCRTVLRANDGIMSHRKNLTALRAIMSNLHVGCRTALRAVVPMSGVGQNLLHIRGGLFFTLPDFWLQLKCERI